MSSKKPKPTKLEVEERKLASVRARIAKQNQEQKKVKSKSGTPLINRISEYREYFVRDENLFVLKTKSSNRSKQTLELVRHVFQKYPVPSFMNYIWNNVDDDKPVYGRQVPRYHEFEMWYICIATGGSLYKEYFKDKALSKKETHAFLNCKYDLTIPQALIYAICKSVGAKDGSALRVARSKLVEKKPTEFWKYVMRFFAHENNITIDQINDLVDYLNHKHVGNPTFTLAGSGQTVESLTKKMKDWHYDLRRMKVIGNATWDGLDVPDQTYNRKFRTGKVQRWFFKQIKTAKDLQQEGNSQRHCVLSYKDRCIKGSVSIWSLSNEDEYGGTHRKLTIEVTEAGSIIQARGIANRSATAEELTLVDAWAKDHGFSVNINRGYYG
jgi:hypothetical protein